MNSTRHCLINGCTKKVAGQGRCYNHYRQARRAGLPKLMRPSVEDRFWSKVDQTGECWVWQAALTKAGYGSIRLKSGAEFAHRLSYRLAYGPIKQGHEIDHRCRNRRCVRPTHLRSVTNKQNQEHRLPTSTRSSSGARGVFWSKKDNRWQVNVMHNRVRHYGGRYASLDDAIEAAANLRNQLFSHNDLDRTA